MALRYFVMMYAGVVVFVHAFLVWNIVRGFRIGMVQYGAIALSVVLMLGLLFRRRLTALPHADHIQDALNLWLGFAFMMTLALLARTGVEGLAWLSDRLFATDLFAAASGYRAVRWSLVVGLAAFAYALLEAQSIRIRNVVVMTDKLPPGVQSLRVAALTDMHITNRTPPATVERIVRLTNDQRPDIVTVIGDCVDSPLDPAGPRAAALAALEAPGGKYAVLGNHELYNGMQQAVRFIQSAGFTLLRGEADISGPLSLVGVDDPQVLERIDIPGALASADPDRFVLLLSHRPEAPAESVGRFDLELAGHTHGGQVWPGHLLVKRLNRFSQGLNRLVGDDGAVSLVYVSNGVRYWGPPVRFLAPPEIIIVDITAAGR